MNISDEYELNNECIVDIFLQNCIYISDKLHYHLSYHYDIPFYIYFKFWLVIKQNQVNI